MVLVNCCKVKERGNGVKWGENQYQELIEKLSVSRTVHSFSVDSEAGTFPVR